MKKICFFMRTPFTLGGEQRVTSVLANYLADQNYDVYFMLTDKNKKIDYEQYNLNNNIKILFLNNYHHLINKVGRKLLKIFRYKSPKNMPLSKQTYCNFLDKKEIIKTINDNEFDYVIGVASEYFSVLSTIKNEIESKIIAWQHSTFESYFSTYNHRFYNQDKFVDYMFKNVDYYVCQTKDDYQKIKEKYNYISIPIANPNTFSNNKQSNLTSKNFVAVGRFSKVKGFDKLIDAFYLFSKKNNDWKLYIIGSGEELNNYKNKIKSYHLESRIILPGATNNVEKYYLDSSILVLTSLWEGWGMVATEAMSYGLPVISFDIPSIKEIFGGKQCGILVEKYNVEKLSDAMLELAENEEKIQEYGKIANRQVKDFDIEKIGKKWIEIFERKDDN